VKNPRPALGDSHGAMKPASYRITVRGRLSDRFVSAFHGMTLEAKNGPLVVTPTHVVNG